MKPFVTTLFCFLSLTLFGQFNDADAYFNGSYDKASVHKNRIKQIKVETFIDSNRAASHLLYFDNEGFLTQQNVFNKDFIKVNEYTFFYNKEGGQIERRQVAHEMNKTYTVTLNKKYNGSQLVQESSSEFPFLTTHLYDDKQRKILSTTFLNGDTAKGPKRVFFYNYNTDGTLKDIQETYTETNHSPIVSLGKTEYVYDEARNISVVIRTGKPKYILSYNQYGLLESKSVKMPEDSSSLNIVDKYSYIFSK